MKEKKRVRRKKCSNCKIKCLNGVCYLGYKTKKIDDEYYSAEDCPNIKTQKDAFNNYPRDSYDECSIKIDLQIKVDHLNDCCCSKECKWITGNGLMPKCIIFGELLWMIGFYNKFGEKISKPFRHANCLSKFINVEY